MVNALVPWFCWLLATALAAQEPPVVACRACSNHGSLPCGKHGRLLADEQDPLLRACSVAAACKSCAGSLATDCKTCRNGAVEAELRRRRELAAQWLAARRAALGEIAAADELVHLETAHVRLRFSIRPTTVGKTKLDTHALAHLYARRITALRELFVATLEIPEADRPGPIDVYMFRDAQDHALVGPRVTGIGTSRSTGVKLMGVDSVYSMWQDLRLLPDDEALHRNLVHHATHLLLCNTKPPQVMNNRKCGWLDEGVAHWFEDRITGKCTNFCFEEVLLQPGAGWKNGRWRVPVRQLVDEGKGRPFAELSTLSTDQLTFEDHALSFALVDHLLAVHGGGKLRLLVERAKRDLPMRDALQEVYGTNPLALDATFRQWVKEHYPSVESR